MNKTVFLAFLIFLSIVDAFAQRNIERSLDEFHSIKVFDQISVRLIPSNEYKAAVSGSYANDVEFVEKNGVLKIRMPLKKLLDGEFTNVNLYVKSLKSIEANEGSSIESISFLETYDLKLEAKEGAEIRLNLKVDFVKSKVVTGGIVVLSGTSGSQEISVGTGGNFDGSQFETTETTVAITAGGNAKVNATETVNAKVRAGGTIEVYGNPSTINQSTTLGGSILRK